MSKDIRNGIDMSTGKVTEIAVPEFHNVPQELKDHNVWINFSSTWSTQKEKWSKPPCDEQGNLLSGGFRNVRSYESVQESQEGNPARIKGVGFSFAAQKHGGIVGLDFDHVVAKDGSILPEVEAILIELGTYTEYSISGDGLHAFVEAEGLDIGGGRGKLVYNNAFGEGTGLEIFKSTGYLTVSGKRIDRFGTTVRGKCKTKLDRVIKKYGKAQTKKAVRDIVDATGDPMFGEIEQFRTEFEERTGIEIKRGVERDDGTWMLYLTQCPWGGGEDAVAGTHEDGTSDAVVFFKAGCQPGFYCFHTTCEGRRWEDLCELFPDLPVGNYIDQYNASYCIVSHGGEVLVVRDGSEGGENDKLHTAKRVKSFLEERAWDKTIINNPAGEDKVILLAKSWVESKHARRYERGFVLKPEKVAGEGKLNLWTGFAKQPDPNGSCDLFNNHCLNVVCGGDKKVYNWMRMWFADILQNPGELPVGSCIILKGENGSGKSIVADFVGEILGTEWCTEVCSPQELSGAFNAHTAQALLLIGAELTFKGDRARHNWIKGITTAKTRNINEKNKPIVKIPNMTRLFLTTNAENAIPADRTERRFLILEVPLIENRRAYFDAMIAQMKKDKGYERLMHELLNVKVDRDALRYVPKTQALREEKADALHGMKRFIEEFLDDGVAPNVERDEVLATWSGCDSWPNYITIDLLHEKYKKIMGDGEEWKGDIITSKASFSRKLRSLCTAMGAPLHSATKAKMDKRIMLPPLEEWRAKWDEYMYG